MAPIVHNRLGCSQSDWITEAVAVSSGFASSVKRRDVRSDDADHQLLEWR